MTPEEAFGKIIKQMRAEKGFSQEHLAHLSDLDRTFISLLERGKRQPSLNSILAIAASLEVAPDRLVAQVVAECRPGSFTSP